MTFEFAYDISLIYQGGKMAANAWSMIRKSGNRFFMLKFLRCREEPRMKRFCGDRTIDGVVVTVDGRPLDQRLDLHRYTANGFEWSYEGEEPRQLSLAILAEHLSDTAAAKALVEPYMKAVVANFGNEWEMSSADIDAALAALRKDGDAVRAAS
ncbi:DUF6166 domain-containing protein [Bradyrhizobium sp. 31Argb]|uniref:DUF6166 domain-containing protein n=1 Tax=Bradyrhizobium sp. 31Argb TaxID=3141247 RepID=UPI0037483353